MLLPAPSTPGARSTDLPPRCVPLGAMLAAPAAPVVYVGAPAVYAAAPALYVAAPAAYAAAPVVYAAVTVDAGCAEVREPGRGTDEERAEGIDDTYEEGAGAAEDAGERPYSCGYWV